MEQAGPKPNILWVCTDQQRWDTLGCYGNDHVETPHLDRLAKQGVLFERAFCQSPVCTPSRASFLTGRYPRTTRCRQNGQRSEEHTSELQSLMRISYAVFCLKKKTKTHRQSHNITDTTH